MLDATHVFYVPLLDQSKLSAKPPEAKADSPIPGHLTSNQICPAQRHMPFEEHDLHEESSQPLGKGAEDLYDLFCQLNESIAKHLSCLPHLFHQLGKLLLFLGQFEFECVLFDHAFFSITGTASGTGSGIGSTIACSAFTCAGSGHNTLDLQRGQTT